jgi:thioredoxin reductase (NADPH)
LSDWLATVPIPYDGIRVAGTLWSPKSHQVKDFLARNRIPYQWLDIEQDLEARALVDASQPDTHRLPVVFVPDGGVLIEPDVITLAEKIGMHIRLMP